jgi:hypothetical protein
MEAPNEIMVPLESRELIIDALRALRAKRPDLIISCQPIRFEGEEGFGQSIDE